MSVNSQLVISTQKGAHLVSHDDSLYQEVQYNKGATWTSIYLQCRIIPNIPILYRSPVSSRSNGFKTVVLITVRYGVRKILLTID